MVVLALVGQVAHAQAPAPNSAADAALAEGRRLYDLQEWDKAIAKFKEAYTLRDDAPALFNIAQAYRLKGDCAQAASFYKTFKRKFPKEKNIDKVSKFITDMEACAKAAKSEPTGTAPPKTEPTKTEPAKIEPTKTEPTKTEPAKTEPAKTEPTKTEPIKTEPTKTEPARTEPIRTEPTKTPADSISATPPPGVESDGGSGGGSSGLRIASYVTLGAGGAGLMLGVVYGLKAMSAASEAEDLEAGATWKPAIQERGERNQKLSTISFVAGGALVAGGVVMLVLSRSSSSEHNAVSIIPTDAGAAFVWAGRF
jgi:tetratricopeptide (TPR) repeat protein